MATSPGKMHALLLFMSICTRSSAAEPATLHGSVLDPNGNALAAQLVLSPSREPIPIIGEFAVPAAVGEHRIVVRSPGFTPFERQITVPSEGLDLGRIILAVEPLRDTVTVQERGGYLTGQIVSATRTPTALLDVPQSVDAIGAEQMRDQNMLSIGDVVRYIPGITSIQGENNRDQLVIRGNSSSADFFLDGVRDDVQYYRDIYNAERIEAIKGPNAMMFGRGGGGGLVNRVSKQPGSAAFRELTFQGGSFGDGRVAADLDQPLGTCAAGRLNAMFEDGGTFRDGVRLKRYGINPTLTFTDNVSTRITASFENFRDFRTADRGIPSFRGAPLDTDSSTFFGRADLSHVRALVNIGMLNVEHQFTSSFGIRNHTLAADYNRGYQNFVPGAVTADAQYDSLSAYNNATRRRNYFNQTDATWTGNPGRLHNTILAGAEFGMQRSDNFRNTGYFNDSSTSILVPLLNPTFTSPIVFRQSATDADNRVRTGTSAVYVQDQISLTARLQLIAGFRADRFNLRYHDNRSGNELARTDRLLSPRAGIVYRVAGPLSLYASYSVSSLPGAGDQFSSLTAITSQLKPERFTNYETGAKFQPGGSLLLTLALYRLDRTNTRSIDPDDATRIVQTGSQRSTGAEAGVSGTVRGKWQIAGGYALQRAVVSSATASARAGAHVAQVPRQTFSLWNNYRLLPRLGAGLGIVNRSEMFAAIDNTVVLPGYTRADAALFARISEHVKAQVNIENLFGLRYILNADNNTNISPGSPRAFRGGITVSF